ncbi:NAD-dependent epimerase/dehydratase family protein [Vulcanococcus sp.]|jgi:nucleoside-diphosphate-sugar epimerase|uniref:NAD-dependent epimerase/dehydratase family protein n=1 Tax=Vulcanococcus sp. TaxID=2856995 RepID=UPI0037DA4ABF
MPAAKIYKTLRFAERKMASSPDLASLYQLLAKQPTPILPSGERRAVLGCGYVGEAVARAWKQEGHELWATTTRRERLSELSELADSPLIFDSTDSSTHLDFVADIDGILISFAPSKSSVVDLTQYRSTFLGGMQRLIETLDRRSHNSPLQLVHLSSCGVYGNRQGAITNETAPTDSEHPVNQVLVQAEEMIASIRSHRIKVCVLRLGGIYGPGRDIPAMLLSAAGGLVQRNGLNVPCWIHRDDIVRGVCFAFEQGLNDTYNLVNDTQLSGQELTDCLCERAGLPLAKWMKINTSDRVLNARVSNDKLKQLGFTFTHPCMVG